MRGKYNFKPVLYMTGVSSQVHVGGQTKYHTVGAGVSSQVHVGGQTKYHTVGAMCRGPNSTQGEVDRA